MSQTCKGYCWGAIINSIRSTDVRYALNVNVLLRQTPNVQIQAELRILFLAEFR